MKKKDQGNKWLIPTHSNSSESHAVRRVNRFSKPLPPPVPEETLPVQQQAQPVQQIQPQQQIQTPHAVSSTQSHAVTRRRGPAPVISPAPSLQKNSGVTQQQAHPPGAESAVSYAPPRLSRMQRQQPPPPPPPTQESAPTSAVSEVLRRSKEPERITHDPMEGQAASRPVSRIRSADIQPAPMPQPSSTVSRARGLAPTDEQRYTPPKPVMAEMPSVTDDEDDGSANPFAGRWNHSEE